MLKLYKYYLYNFFMNSEPTWDNELEYSLDIYWEEEIDSHYLLNYVWNLIEWKKIVTFWEEHNLNADKSFSEILEYKEIIFYVYSIMQYWAKFQDIVLDLKDRVPVEEKEKLISFIEYIFSILENKLSIKHSSTRVFSSFIVSACQKEWFTDIVFEWFNESSPNRSYELSKDKIWFLMIMISSMLYWFKIHWAYDSNPLFNATWIARNFEEQIDKIIDNNPESKVITYNGWVHNMTTPIKWEYKLFWSTINLEELSFAPYLINKYGSDYLSIDLVDWFWKVSNSSHYSFLKWKATKNKIKIIEHSEWQKAIILPINKPDISENIDDILQS